MRVIVVSTHRSDKAHYAPLLRCLRADPRIDVTLYAVNDFYARPDYLDAVRPLEATKGKNAPKTFDAGVVLGDRYEMLFAAMQLVEARIPLLHIHGGEHTYGSLDERWRWAMTAIADVHCTATKEAAREIMGSADPHELYGKWAFDSAVHVTGAPGLDGITDRQPPAYPSKVIALVNPEITEQDSQRTADAVHEGMRNSNYSGLWWESNGDRHAQCCAPYVTRVGTDAETFRDHLAAAQVIVGNSSAGIIEAPSLGTWAVNVGERQAGRARAGNVIDVPADGEAIRAAINDALTRPRFVGPNPYGDGSACPRIRDVLLGMAK